MPGSKIDTETLLSWAVGSIFILAILPIAEPVREFAKGLIGSSSPSKPDRISSSELRAELAQPALFRELETAELEELFQGMAYHLHGRDAEALPILGKFALLGDVRAQGAIGSMYYFGRGLPLERDEGIRWLRLAARQGGLTERQALAAALSGTWQWDGSSAEPEMAYAPSAPKAAGFAPALPPQTRSGYAPGYEASMAYGTGTAISPSPPMGARRSVEEAYGSGPASRRYSGTMGGAPQIGAGSSVILNRAGPGTYSDGSGDIYTQAGPHGVINTRTGEFSPTN